MNHEHGGWVASAQAWIESQGDAGDWSRREILDPALETILHDVRGLSVLDIGCGDGRYARQLAARGAMLTGLDPVPAFIERAQALHIDGTYIVGIAEALPFPDRSFDIVLSYLSIIDVPDYVAAIREMCRVLKRDGRAILVTMSNIASTSDGWVKDAQGKRLHRPVDRYMEEFAMDLEWQDIRIRNFHRPLSGILRPFFESGMMIDGFHEPLPSPDLREFADEARAPTFQIITFRFAAES